MLESDTLSGSPTGLFTLDSALAAYLVGRSTQRFGKRMGWHTGSSPEDWHPSSVVGSVVRTSDFRGTHRAFLLLAKNMLLVMSHALFGGSQASRIVAMANPSIVGRARLQRWCRIGFVQRGALEDGAGQRPQIERTQRPARAHLLADAVDEAGCTRRWSGDRTPRSQ